MKIYPKTYENVFNRPFLRSNNMPKCRIDQVSAASMPLSQYVINLRKTLTEFDLFLFDYLIKFLWLFRQFQYQGKKRQIHKNGVYLDGAFAFFMRHYIGYDTRFIMRNAAWMRIITYIDDFFPNFNKLNPFQQKLNYPYKHLSLSYLVVVWMMDERLDMLAEAEKQKMGYTFFLDYVINYINNYNEEHGVEKYIFIYDNHFYILPHVRKIQK